MGGKNLGFKIFLGMAIAFLIMSPFYISFSQDVESLIKEGDKLWAQRGDIDKLKGSIAFYENALRVDPKNEDALVKLCHAYCYMGSYVLIKKAEKKEMFEKGIKTGESAVEINPQSAGGNFWLAINMGRLGELKGAVSSAFMLPKVIKLLDIVEEVEPGYFHGGYYRFWGRVFYKTPGFILGILSKTLPEKHRKPGGYTKEDQIISYLDAIKIEPNFFMNHVYLAESYLQLKRLNLAREELEWVINTPVGILPEAMPENNYWKEEAKKLLEEIKK
ncbi:MAG: hypothetical protein J7L53_06880 [Deltaproteobacteria bacterium]|nr:hypothetical protein [Deltaproteobacteria bacterium]